MKNILIYLMILVLFSCSVSKDIGVKKENVVFDNNCDSVVENYNEVNVDQIVSIEKEEGKLPNFINPTINNREVSLPKRSKIVNDNSEVLVNDYVDDTKVKKSNGLLAYNIPDELIVGEYFSVTVRISKNKNKQSIVLGSRGITIYDGDVNSNVNIELIDIKSSMSAQLLGDDSRFKITPLSSDFQDIDDNDYTEWSWRVMPLKSGKSYMKLLIRTKNKVDDTYKDITIFDKKILVKPNIKYSVGGWLSNNWQYLFSTLLIPVFTWWWSNRRKKKRSK
jgi:hypothetical protein